MSDTLFRKAAIKGQFFLTENAEKEAAKRVTIGDALTLIHEPGNQADPLAVAAHVGNMRVGYVQREISAAIIWFQANGFAVDCVVVELGKSGNLLCDITVTPP